MEEGEEGLFDFTLLDAEDPFELDEGNIPHLNKHVHIIDRKDIALGVEDIYEVYLYGDPVYVEAKPPAHWLMLGWVPEIDLVVVPLMPPKVDNVTKCYPVGVYAAGSELREMYDNAIG